MEENLRKFCQSHEHFRGGRSGFQYKAAAQLITGQACGDAIQRGTLQITEEQAKVADIAYNQLAQMAAAIGKERGGVRDLILSNMTIDAFTNLMEKHFVCPVSDKKVLYQSMYLDVYNKSKKKK